MSHTPLAKPGALVNWTPKAEGPKAVAGPIKARNDLNGKDTARRSASCTCSTTSLFKSPETSSQQNMDSKLGQTPLTRMIQSALMLLLSERKWKMKLKDWGYDKYIPAKDMTTLVMKAEKRAREEGKETDFFHCNERVTTERLTKFKRSKLAHVQENLESMVDAATPQNITYHTPGADISAELEDMALDDDDYHEHQDTVVRSADDCRVVGHHSNSTFTSEDKKREISCPIIFAHSMPASSLTFQPMDSNNNSPVPTDHERKPWQAAECARKTSVGPIVSRKELEASSQVHGQVLCVSPSAIFGPPPRHHAQRTALDLTKQRHLPSTHAKTARSPDEIVDRAKSSAVVNFAGAVDTVKTDPGNDLLQLAVDLLESPTAPAVQIERRIRALIKSPIALNVEDSTFTYRNSLYEAIYTNCRRLNPDHAADLMYRHAYFLARHGHNDAGQARFVEAIWLRRIVGCDSGTFVKTYFEGVIGSIFDLRRGLPDFVCLVLECLEDYFKSRTFRSQPDATVASGSVAIGDQWHHVSLLVNELRSFTEDEQGRTALGGRWWLRELSLENQLRILLQLFKIAEATPKCIANSDARSALATASCAALEMERFQDEECTHEKMKVYLAISSHYREHGDLDKALEAIRLGYKTLLFSCSEVSRQLLERSREFLQDHWAKFEYLPPDNASEYSKFREIRSLDEELSFRMKSLTAQTFLGESRHKVATSESFRDEGSSDWVDDDKDEENPYGVTCSLGPSIVGVSYSKYMVP